MVSATTPPAGRGPGHRPGPPDPWRRPRTPAARVIRAHLNHPSRHTVRAYAGDLANLRAFLGRRTEEAAVAAILALPPGDGHELGDEYLQWLRASGHAPATVWRRVMSLRALIRAARNLGLLYWTIDTKAPRPKPLRDTAGPGYDGFAAMLAAASARADARGVRDVALLRLLHDLALRASEALTLDTEHVDLRLRRVAVMGKGDLERTWLDLPLETADALAAWLAARGPGPVPLFTGRRGRDADDAGRLTYAGLYDIVARLAAAAGLARCTPHGLRHQAITAALDATGGDVRTVQSFSRHASIQAVCRYDDERRNHAADIAQRVATAATGNPLDLARVTARRPPWPPAEGAMGGPTRDN